MYWLSCKRVHFKHFSLQLVFDRIDKIVISWRLVFFKRKQKYIEVTPYSSSTTEFIPGFSMACITQLFVFCAMFCGLFIVSSSLLSIVLSVLHTASDYPFGIFKPFFVSYCQSLTTFIHWQSLLHTFVVTYTLLWTIIKFINLHVCRDKTLIVP